MPCCLKPSSGFQKLAWPRTCITQLLPFVSHSFQLLPASALALAVPSAPHVLPTHRQLALVIQVSTQCPLLEAIPDFSLPQAHPLFYRLCGSLLKFSVTSWLLVCFWFPSLPVSPVRARSGRDLPFARRVKVTEMGAG